MKIFNLIKEFCFPSASASKEETKYYIVEIKFYSSNECPKIYDELEEIKGKNNKVESMKYKKFFYEFDSAYKYWLDKLELFNK